MCRESVQICKTNITLMWTLSWQGMVCTVAVLKIPSILPVKSIVRNKSQCHREKSFLRSQQLLSYSLNYLFLKNTWVHYYFHHSLSHTLAHNSFIPPIFCSHIYSSLKNSTIMAHIFNAMLTHKNETHKKGRHWQLTENLTTPTDLKLAQKTPDEIQTTNITNHNLNYLY